MLLVLSLALATAGPTQLDKALVLDVKPGGEGTQEVAKAVTSLLAVELQKRFQVITSGDMRAILEQEANKQALGCDATAQSCLAELAGALGANIAFYGDAQKLGDLTLVTLNAFDAKKGAALGRASIEVTDLQELPARVRQAVPELLGAPPSQSSAFGTAGVVGVVAAGVGVAAAVGAGGWALAMGGVAADPTSKRADKELAFNTQDPAAYAAIAGAVLALAGAAVVVVDLALE